MPFITQNKTNWKFVLIVVVLGVIVGGGILAFLIFVPVEVITRISPTLICEKDSDCVNTCCGCISINEECNRECFVLPERECICTNGKCGQKQNKNTKEFTISLNEKANILYSEDENEYELAINNIDIQSQKVNIYSSFSEGLPCLAQPKTQNIKIGEQINCFNTEECATYFKLINLESERATFETWYTCAPPGSEEIILPKEIIITEKDETADWQTYRNEEYGFEIKYPEELIDLEQEPFESYLKMTDPNFTVIKGLQMKNPDPDKYHEYPIEGVIQFMVATSSEVVSSCLEPAAEEGDEIYNISNEIINGIKFARYDHEGLGLGNRLSEQVFSAVLNNICYRVEIIVVGYGFEIGAELTREKAEKDKVEFDLAFSVYDVFDTLRPVLSTFRFIEKPQSGNKILFVYLTDKQYDGNLGGRPGADAKCVPPIGLNCESGTVHSLITVSKDDSILNMAENYNFNTDIPIYWYNRDTKGTLILVNTWGEMINVDGNGINSDIINGQEEGTGIYDFPWTGGLGDEDVDSCSQWTSNEGDLEGGAGPYGIIGGRWEEDFFGAEGWAGISFAMICKNQRYLRCICEGSI